MENFVYFCLGLLCSFIIDLFFPSLRDWVLSLLSHIQQKISGNPINISDTWQAEFTEQDAQGKVLQSTETIKIKHHGARLEATGNIGAPHPRSFKYTGKVYHDLVWGTYEKEGTNTGSLEGKGVFILKINPERNEMKGFCTYHDRDTGTLEHSPYVWRRIQ